MTNNSAQDGVQPVYLAAEQGHDDVVRMLVNEFHVHPDAPRNVPTITTCIVIVAPLMMLI